jgi:hypothetical protein
MGFLRRNVSEIKENLKQDFSLIISSKEEVQMLVLNRKPRTPCIFQVRAR